MVPLLRAGSVASAVALLGCELIGDVSGYRAETQSSAATGASSSSASQTSSGASGGGGGSGGAPSDGGGGDTDLCGTLFADTFSDDTIDEDLWGTVGDGAVEAAGSAHMTADRGGVRRGIRTKMEYDFDDGWVVAEIENAMSDGGRLSLRYNKTGEDDFISFDIHDGTLTAERQTDANTMPLEEAPFNGDQHRFLRLRDEGDDMHWETSSDGVDWNSFHIGPSHNLISGTTVELFAATNGSTQVYLRVAQVVACGTRE